MCLSGFSQYLHDIILSTMKMTLRGSQRKRKKTSGFRARMATPGGRRVLSRRRNRGRAKLAI